jgi:hypothetical protein
MHIGKVTVGVCTPNYYYYVRGLMVVGGDTENFLYAFDRTCRGNKQAPLSAAVYRFLFNKNESSEIL